MSQDPPSAPPAPMSTPIDPIVERLDRHSRLLEEMVRLHTENAAFTADLTVHITAARRLGYALVASHPDPRALANEFHHQMDLVADDIPQARLDAYREVMQGINVVIMEAVNREPGKA